MCCARFFDLQQCDTWYVGCSKMRGQASRSRLTLMWPNVAWSRSREPDAPQRADAVLQRMESAYENGNVKARADSTTYNSLINGKWARDL